jgi:hypothetical protein
MDATAEFLAALMPRLTEAEIARHGGDPAQRIAMWSRGDPVTLFGAATTVQGWEEISPVFAWLGSAFADLQSYRMEVLAAGVSADLAYLVALEHVTNSMNEAPPQGLHTAGDDRVPPRERAVAGRAPARRPAHRAVRRRAGRSADQSRAVRLTSG